MDRYVEEQLRIHFRTKQRSPFIDLGLSENDVRKLIRTFQGIARRRSHGRYFLTDIDAFSNVNVALAALCISKRNRKPVHAEFCLNEFMESAKFDFANKGLAYLPNLFRYFFTHYQREMFGSHQVQLVGGNDNDEPQLDLDALAVDDAFSPEEEANIVRVNKIWEACFDVLPAIQKMVIGLLLDGMSQTEIAEVMARSSTTVHHLKNQAGQNIMACLSQHGIGREDIESLMMFRSLG